MGSNRTGESYGISPRDPLYARRGMDPWTFPGQDTASMDSYRKPLIIGLPGLQNGHISDLPMDMEATLNLDGVSPLDGLLHDPRVPGLTMEDNSYFTPATSSQTTPGEYDGAEYVYPDRNSSKPFGKPLVGTSQDHGLYGQATLPIGGNSSQSYPWDGPGAAPSFGAERLLSPSNNLNHHNEVKESHLLSQQQHIYTYNNPPYLPLSPARSAAGLSFDEQQESNSASPKGYIESSVQGISECRGPRLRCDWPNCVSSVGGQVFARPSSFKRHMDRHKKPYRCYHEHCRRHQDGFSRLDNLHTHLNGKRHRKQNCCKSDAPEAKREKIENLRKELRILEHGE